MRTRIAADNPYSADRYGFAWEQIPPRGRAHLDLGCYDGQFLDALRPKGIGRLVGVDVCGPAIERARAKRPGIEFYHMPADQGLPFPDASFDSVSLLDVLEHVADQRRLLAEVRRVLAPQGRLIVTVPGSHVFSFLDVGNLKFRFPRLHRWYYCRNHTRQEYRQRYVDSPDGLVGDVDAAKAWHEHFRRSGLAELLGSADLAVSAMDGSGLFFRPLSVLMQLTAWAKPLQRALRRLRQADSRAFASANVFCVATPASVEAAVAAAGPGRTAPA